MIKINLRKKILLGFFNFNLYIFAKLIITKELNVRAKLNKADMYLQEKNKMNEITKTKAKKRNKKPRP